MFFEVWMIIVLVLVFGLCAWHSTNSGFRRGAISTLESLVEDRIIHINNDGSIVPYSVYPTVKKKKRINNKNIV